MSRSFISDIMASLHKPKAQPEKTVVKERPPETPEEKSPFFFTMTEICSMIGVGEIVVTLLRSVTVPTVALMSRRVVLAFTEVAEAVPGMSSVTKGRSITSPRLIIRRGSRFSINAR